MNLKKGISRFALMTVVASTTVVQAHAERDRYGTIIEKIIVESGGNVVIGFPEDLAETIFLTNTGKNTAQELRPGINKTVGYRIQVFSDGRNQSSLEARAKARGSAILGKFPKYRGQVYTYSNSPNWYTRVGNFQNQSEAGNALDELKKAFPNYASEMRIVKTQIVVIK